MVFIPVEKEFLDESGGYWYVAGNPEPLDLRAVIAFTIRRTPVETGDDSDRSREILKTIRANTGEGIQLDEDDYNWMMVQFKAFAHRVWLGPDSSFLREHIESVANSSE